MVEYYLLFFAGTLLAQVNNLLIFKKFQLSAGTSLPSNIMYLLINAVISAVIPGAVMVAGGMPLEFSWYSIVIATTIVSLSAVNVFVTLKCYALGQIATASILGTLGNIILPCLWGVLILKEALSFQSILAIVIMLAAVVLLGTGTGERLNKKLIGLYGIIIVTTACVNILSKQHQVETAYTTVDTLSFSVWVAIARLVLFSFITPFVAKIQGKASFRFSKYAIWLAVISSVIAGTSYVLTLTANTTLPIVITSPLSTGMNIILSAMLPWLVYREQLSKKQMIGVGLSFAGALLFLLG